MSTKTLARFTDVAQVLDAALQSGGARYVLSRRGEAVKFRHRCYAYRAALARLDAERKANMPGTAPSTRFDTLVIRIGAKGTTEEATLLIEFNQPKGQLLGLDGKPLTPVNRPSDAEDPLLAEAQRLLAHEDFDIEID